MISVLLAVTKEQALFGLCVQLFAVVVLLCAFIHWGLRTPRARTIPEAKVSTQLALAAPPGDRPARGCPRCGAEMATDQALGVDVGECPSCGTVATVQWSGAA